MFLVQCLTMIFEILVVFYCDEWVWNY